MRERRALLRRRDGCKALKIPNQGEVVQVRWLIPDNYSGYSAASKLSSKRVVGIQYREVV
jgi:hypothetical protein